MCKCKYYYDATSFSETKESFDARSMHRRYILKWGLPAKMGGAFFFLQNHVPLFETGHALRKQEEAERVDLRAGRAASTLILLHRMPFCFWFTGKPILHVGPAEWKGSLFM